MTKKSVWNIGCLVAVLGIAGFAASVALADNELVPITPQIGTNSGCVGVYTGLARMTNGTGSIWITPTNKSTKYGVFTDASEFSPPYSSVATMINLTNPAVNCGSNSITFPATYGSRYELTVYIQSSPLPTNSALNLQLQWH